MNGRVSKQGASAWLGGLRTRARRGVAVLLATLGFAGVSRADFNYDRTETVHYLTASAGGSTTNVPPGTVTPVSVDGTTTTWEVWIDENGNTENRNESSGPLAYTTIDCAVTLGDGVLDSATVVTDAAGHGTVNLTMGNDNTRVVFTYDTATATVNFTAPPPEVFTYHHSESSLTGTLTATGSTSGVPNGEERPVTFHATYSTWDVWMSNLGNSQIRDLSTIPASGGSVAFTVEGGGGIMVGTYTTDGNGDAFATYTMGATSGRVRAEMAYGAHSVTANLDFTPPSQEEVFTYHHSEAALTSALSVNGGSTVEVPEGELRTLSLYASYSTWDVWMSNLGNSQVRNESTSPAGGASVTFTVESGGGGVSPANATTDGSGYTTSMFTMGGANGRVRADVSYNGHTHASSLDFTAPGGEEEEVFVYDHTEVTLTAVASGNGPTSNLNPGDSTGPLITATYVTHEVWVSNLGNSENRNTSSAPAFGIGAGFEVIAGDGVLSWGNSTTASNGQAYAYMSMGSQPTTTVRGTVSDGTRTATATVDFTLAPVVEIFTLDHTEATLGVTLDAPDGTAIPVSGSKPVRARVMLTSWEVWVGNLGTVQERNHTTTPVSNATVNFNIDNNAFGASINNGYGQNTDGQGYAYAQVYVNMEAPVVRADASDYPRTATNTIGFSIDYGPPPEEYVYHHSETSYGVSLVSVVDPTTNVMPGESRQLGVAGGVSYWEIWVSNYGNSETRNYSFTPYESLYVNVDYGDGTVSGSGLFWTFTMGTQATRLSVSRDGATATLEFTPGEVFEYSHNIMSLTAQLSAPSGRERVPQGDTRPVTVSVSYQSAEIWIGSQGTVQERNPTSGQATDQPVSFGIINGGDAALSPASGMTDGNGEMTTTLTMGAVDSQVYVVVGHPGTTAEASLTFTAEYQPDHSESALDLSFTSDGSTTEVMPNETRNLSLHATYRTWDIYTNPAGMQQERNSMSVDAMGASVGFSIASGGDGAVTPSSTSTDGSGNAGATFTMGTGASQVIADVSYYNGAATVTAVATLNFTPPAEEVFVHESTQVTPSISVTGGGENVVQGDVRAVQVHVALDSVEIWRSTTTSNFQYRNATSSDLGNATVDYTVEGGDGTVDTTSSSTDYAGNTSANFTMGTQATTVRATVTHESITVSGTTTFSP